MFILLCQDFPCHPPLFWKNSEPLLTHYWQWKQWYWILIHNVIFILDFNTSKPVSPYVIFSAIQLYLLSTTTKLAKGVDTVELIRYTTVSYINFLHCVKAKEKRCVLWEFENKKWLYLFKVQGQSTHFCTNNSKRAIPSCFSTMF